MALSLAYVNEVLNHLDSTVVVDEPTWIELIKALKFEGRPLEDLVISRMRLRWCPGGWAGMLAKLDQLEADKKTLSTQVHDLTKQLEKAQALREAKKVVDGKS